jgi:ribonuclease P/MRP protein subunit POP1
LAALRHAILFGEYPEDGAVDGAGWLSDGGGRTEAQRIVGTVPRHLRRRTRSHERRRMPLKLRLRPLKRHDTSLRCRKFQRSPSRLHSLWRERASSAAAAVTAGVANDAVSSTLRLETHAWCSKRFHMEDLWGFRIPVTVLDKGERAVCRVRRHTVRRAALTV